MSGSAKAINTKRKAAPVVTSANKEELNGYYEALLKQSKGAQFADKKAAISRLRTTYNRKKATIDNWPSSLEEAASMVEGLSMERSVAKKTPQSHSSSASSGNNTKRRGAGGNRGGRNTNKGLDGMLEASAAYGTIEKLNPDFDMEIKEEEEDVAGYLGAEVKFETSGEDDTEYHEYRVDEKGAMDELDEVRNDPLDVSIDRLKMQSGNIETLVPHATKRTTLINNSGLPHFSTLSDFFTHYKEGDPFSKSTGNKEDKTQRSKGDSSSSSSSSYLNGYEQRLLLGSDNENAQDSTLVTPESIPGIPFSGDESTMVITDVSPLDGLSYEERAKAIEKARAARDKKFEDLIIKQGLYSTIEDSDTYKTLLYIRSTKPFWFMEKQREDEEGAIFPRTTDLSPDDVDLMLISPFGPFPACANGGMCFASTLRNNMGVKRLIGYVDPKTFRECLENNTSPRNLPCLMCLLVYWRVFFDETCRKGKPVDEIKWPFRFKMGPGGYRSEAMISTLEGSPCQVVVPFRNILATDFVPATKDISWNVKIRADHRSHMRSASNSSSSSSGNGSEWIEPDDDRSMTTRPVKYMVVQKKMRVSGFAERKELLYPVDGSDTVRHFMLNCPRFLDRAKTWTSPPTHITNAAAMIFSGAEKSREGRGGKKGKGSRLNAFVSLCPSNFSDIVDLVYTERKPPTFLSEQQQQQQQQQRSDSGKEPKMLRKSIGTAEDGDEGIEDEEQSRGNNNNDDKEVDTTWAKISSFGVDRNSWVNDCLYNMENVMYDLPGPVSFPGRLSLRVEHVSARMEGSLADAAPVIEEVVLDSEPVKNKEDYSFSTKSLLQRALYSSNWLKDYMEKEAKSQGLVVDDISEAVRMVIELMGDLEDSRQHLKDFLRGQVGQCRDQGNVIKGKDAPFVLFSKFKHFSLHRKHDQEGDDDNDGNGDNEEHREAICDKYAEAPEDEIGHSYYYASLYSINMAIGLARYLDELTISECLESGKGGAAKSRIRNTVSTRDHFSHASSESRLDPAVKKSIDAMEDSTKQNLGCPKKKPDPVDKMKSPAIRSLEGKLVTFVSSHSPLADWFESRMLLGADISDNSLKSAIRSDPELEVTSPDYMVTEEDLKDREDQQVTVRLPYPSEYCDQYYKKFLGNTPHARLIRIESSSLKSSRPRVVDGFSPFSREIDPRMAADMNREEEAEAREEERWFSEHGTYEWDYLHDNGNNEDGEENVDTTLPFCGVLTKCVSLDHSGTPRPWNNRDEAVRNLVLDFITHSNPHYRSFTSGQEDHVNTLNMFEEFDDTVRKLRSMDRITLSKLYGSVIGQASLYMEATGSGKMMNEMDIKETNRRFSGWFPRIIEMELMDHDWFLCSWDRNVRNHEEGNIPYEGDPLEDDVECGGRDKRTYYVVTSLLMRMRLTEELLDRVYALIYWRKHSKDQNRDAEQHSAQMAELKDFAYRLRMFRDTHVPLANFVLRSRRCDDKYLYSPVSTDIGIPAYSIHYPSPGRSRHEGDLPDFSRYVSHIRFLSEGGKKVMLLRILAKLLPGVCFKRTIREKHVIYSACSPAYASLFERCCFFFSMGLYSHCESWPDMDSCVKLHDFFENYPKPDPIQRLQFCEYMRDKKLTATKIHGLFEYFRLGRTRRDTVSYCMTKKIPLEDIEILKYYHGLCVSGDALVSFANENMATTTCILREFVLKLIKNDWVYEHGIRMTFSRWNKFVEASCSAADSIRNRFVRTQGFHESDSIVSKINDMDPSKITYRIYSENLVKYLSHLFARIDSEEKQAVQEGVLRSEDSHVDYRLSHDHYALISARVRSRSPTSEVRLEDLLAFGLSREGYGVVCGVREQFQQRFGDTHIARELKSMDRHDYQVVHAYFRAMDEHQRVTAYHVPRDIAMKQMAALKRRYGMPQDMNVTDHMRAFMVSQCCHKVKTFVVEGESKIGYMGTSTCYWDDYMKDFYCYKKAPSKTQKTSRTRKSVSAPSGKEEGDNDGVISETSSTIMGEEAETEKEKKDRGKRKRGKKHGLSLAALDYPTTPQMEQGKEESVMTVVETESEICSSMSMDTNGTLLGGIEEEEEESFMTDGELDEGEGIPWDPNMNLGLTITSMTLSDECDQAASSTSGDMKAYEGSIVSWESRIHNYGLGAGVTSLIRTGIRIKRSDGESDDEDDDEEEDDDDEEDEPETLTTDEVITNVEELKDVIGGSVSKILTTTATTAIATAIDTESSSVVDVPKYNDKSPFIGIKQKNKRQKIYDKYKFECGKVPLVRVSVLGKVVQYTSQSESSSPSSYTICTYCGQVCPYSVAGYFGGDYTCGFCDQAYRASISCPSCVRCGDRLAFDEYVTECQTWLVVDDTENGGLETSWRVTCRSCSFIISNITGTDPFVTLSEIMRTTDGAEADSIRYLWWQSKSNGDQAASVSLASITSRKRKRGVGANISSSTSINKPGRGRRKTLLDQPVGGTTNNLALAVAVGEFKDNNTTPVIPVNAEPVVKEGPKRAPYKRAPRAKRATLNNNNNINSSTTAHSSLATTVGRFIGTDMGSLSSISISTSTSSSVTTKENKAPSQQNRYVPSLPLPSVIKKTGRSKPTQSRANLEAAIRRLKANSTRPTTGNRSTLTKV